MNWQVMLIFAIVLGVYFIGLIVFAVIKRYYNKKKFQDQEKEAAKDESINKE